MITNKKLYILKTILVFSSLILLGVSSFAQQNVNNLFYCNSTNNISKIWVIDDNTALGTRTVNSKTNYVKDIVLLKNGLFVDSLSLQQFYGNFTDYRLSHIDEIIFHSQHNYLVICGNLTFPLKVEGNKLVMEKTSRSPLQISPSWREEYPYLEVHSIGKIGNLIIGYQRDNASKKRNGISDQDEKNFPEFWIAHVENGVVSKVLKINEREEKLTDDLFIDTKDWSIVSSRVNIFQKFYSYNNQKIFFNVVRANKCYIYDIKENNVKAIIFPPIEKGESCFYYHDYITEQNYFVKKRKKKNQYQLFQLSPTLDKAYLVKEIDFFPHAIVNGKIHKIEEEKEEKNNFMCHYLIPIKENDSNENNINILKEITIQIK